MITGSDNAFRYDELNRIRTASKKITTFGRSAKFDPLNKATLDATAPYELSFSETFAFSADHALNIMQRSIAQRALGSTDIRNKSLTLAYNFSDDSRYPRHAPMTISRMTKVDTKGAQSATIKMGYDERGRMGVSVCDNEPICAGDQPERRYFWHAEDTLHTTRADKENPEFTKIDKRVVAWYDRVDSEYGYDGQRLFRVRNEEGWETPPSEDQGSRLTDRRIADSLYLDPTLTVTRQGNGKPQALVHLFAGSARLASVWLPDKEGDDTQVFTYHAQLQTRNISDVVRSTLGKPQTARLHQQVEYAAFGEMVDERERSLDENLVAFPNGGKRPLTSREAAGLAHYRFNGKEQDETGITDFGARSYDTRLALWLRPDPALMNYLAGGSSGGIYSSKNLASFQFGQQNPISYRDDDGRIANFVAGGVTNAVIGSVIQAAEMGVGVRKEFSYKQLAADFAIGFATSGLGAWANAARLGELGAETLGHAPQIVEAGGAAARELTITANSIRGAQAEAEAVDILVNMKGQKLIGTQMHMVGEGGERIFVDIVSKNPSGDIILHEVKSGGAFLNSRQNKLFIEEGVEYFKFSGQKTMEQWEKAIAEKIINPDALPAFKRSLIGIAN